MEKENIQLILLKNNEITVVSHLIYHDKTLKKLFSNPHNVISRQLNSLYAFKIVYKNKIVGFINLVYNKRTDNVEIDIGIKEQFRNMGIGTISLLKLKEFLRINKELLELNIIAEINSDNISCIKSLNNSGYSKNIIYRDV